MLIDFDACYFSSVIIPPFNLDTFLVWFIIAYFLGHLVQGISNLINSIKPLRFLIPEDKGSFNEMQIEILFQAKKYFGVQKQYNDRLWNLCYMLASAKDITGQVQAFNSYYSLYRGWFVIFTLFIQAITLLSTYHHKLNQAEQTALLVGEPQANTC